MNNLNNQFKNGILPKELCYNLEISCIDFNKLQYNSRYQSYDFYAKKFPKGWGDEPLFTDLIGTIANTARINNFTPLQELNNMSKNNIEHNGSVTSQ